MYPLKPQQISMPSELESSELKNLGTLETLALDKLIEVSTGAISKSITSESLFAGARELVISHAGGEYRLRLTNQGKLILTK